MQDLAQLRREIDAIDAEMASLFERRMRAAGGVAEAKRASGAPVFDPAREDAVVQKNGAAIRDPALLPYYQRFLRQLMGLSKDYQRALLGRDIVAYQGAEGSFSHTVLGTLFPLARPLATPTFEGVFEAVESGEAAHGIVPFENSATGDVSGVLDLCYTHTGCFVCAMYDLPVHQNLLGVPGATLADVRTVVSHVQALEQSRRFLDSLGVQRQPFANTALAAEQVAALGDKSVAAIAGLDAAGRYGLVPLATDIAGEADNTTRFIVLAREAPAQGDHFSLLLSVDNRVGALAGVIQTISAAGFDMECIKSRPQPHRAFEYYFYIELVGGAHTAGGEALLKALGASCRTVRLLGDYTRI